MKCKNITKELEYLSNPAAIIDMVRYEITYGKFVMRSF